MLISMYVLKGNFPNNFVRLGMLDKI